MKKIVLIAALLGFFLLGLAGCTDLITGNSQKVIKPADEEKQETAQEAERESGAPEQSAEEFDNGPTAEEQAIYEEVWYGVHSEDNPGRRRMPSEFILPNRDPNVYDAWVNETYDLGIAYQNKIIAEVGTRHGMSADEVKEIYSKVIKWRFDNGMPTDPSL